MHEALRIDPKFWNARFNLAEIPFLKKDWLEARTRFQDLLTNNVSELQGDAAQLIQYKILLTYLLEGKENMVDSILAKFELSPDTPAVHYANAAIALQHDGCTGRGCSISAFTTVANASIVLPRLTALNQTEDANKKKRDWLTRLCRLDLSLQRETEPETGDATWNSAISR